MTVFPTWCDQVGLVLLRQVLDSNGHCQQTKYSVAFALKKERAMKMNAKKQQKLTYIYFMSTTTKFISKEFWLGGI